MKKSQKLNVMLIVLCLKIIFIFLEIDFVYIEMKEVSFKTELKFSFNSATITSNCNLMDEFCFHLLMLLVMEIQQSDNFYQLMIWNKKLQYKIEHWKNPKDFV